MTSTASTATASDSGDSKEETRPTGANGANVRSDADLSERRKCLQIIRQLDTVYPNKPLPGTTDTAGVYAMKYVVSHYLKRTSHHADPVQGHDGKTAAARKRKRKRPPTQSNRSANAIDTPDKGKRQKTFDFPLELDGHFTFVPATTT